MSELDLQVWKLNSLLEELGLSRGLLDLLLSSPGMLLSVSRSDSSVLESCLILCDELGTWSSDLSSSYSSEVVAVSPGGALGWGARLAGFDGLSLLPGFVVGELLGKSGEFCGAL